MLSYQKQYKTVNQTITILLVLGKSFTSCSQAKERKSVLIKILLDMRQKYRQNEVIFN